MVKGINQDEHKMLLEQPLDWVNLGEEYKERRTYQGLIVPPDGNKLMIVSPISGLVFELWRKQLNADMFTIEGDMIFKPDMETYKEFQRVQGEGLKRIK